MSPVIWFVIGLFGFIFGLGFLINRLMRLLNGRIRRRTFSLIEMVIIAGIAFGIIGMFQPFVIDGFRVGFNLLFFSTLAYTIWSHIRPRAAQIDEP